MKDIKFVGLHARESDLPSMASAIHKNTWTIALTTEEKH
jgi:hypothetical protein